MTYDIGWVLMTRAGGAVKRCHTMMVHGEYNVAAHSFGVAQLIIAFEGGHPSLDLLKATLFHDLAEQVVGDVPAPVKWDYGDRYAQVEVDFNLANNLAMPLKPQEVALLRWADMFEFMLWCTEQYRMGNSHARGLFDRVAVRLRPDLDSMPERVRKIYLGVLEDHAYLEFHQDYLPEEYGD